MTKNTYTLGGITFTTQKKAKEHFRWVKSGPIEPITKHHPDFAFLRDVYTHSPYAPVEEIVLIRFAYHPNHGGTERGAILTLANGKTVDFPSATYGLETTDKQMAENPWPQWEKIKKRKLSGKMRLMVKYQIDDFRDNHPTGRCECCGAPGEDVDHKEPWEFAAIRDLWFMGIDMFSLETVDDTPDSAQPRFANYDLYADWLDHHMTYAEYQLLCKHCHKNKPKEAA